MDATFAALATFPAALEKHYALFPAQFVRWSPSSSDAVPSLQWLPGKIAAGRA